MLWVSVSLQPVLLAEKSVHGVKQLTIKQDEIFWYLISPFYFPVTEQSLFPLWIGKYQSSLCQSCCLAGLSH